MKTKQTQKIISSLLFIGAFLFLLAGGQSLQAQTQILTNSFTSPDGSTPMPFDYVANGIIADTNWDGVYEQYGDIVLGATTVRQAVGGNLAVTVTANMTGYPSLPSGPPQGANGNYTPGPAVVGALGIQQPGGGWSGGAADDGFYLWKVVSGDFDVAVRSLPVWPLTGDIFAGITVRPYNTNGTGAPVRFTAGTANEGFLSLNRDQVFAIDEIRYISNGTGTEITFQDESYTNGTGAPINPSDTVAGTNQSRLLRVSRHQFTNFTFYIATNVGDVWSPVTNGGGAIANTYTGPNTIGLAGPGTVYRTDWASAVQFQVGISLGTYVSGADTECFWDQFQITGTNLNLPDNVDITGPSNPGTNNPNPNGTIQLTWTEGQFGNGAPANSLVIVRPQVTGEVPRIQSGPISGYFLPPADGNLKDTSVVGLTTTNIIMTNVAVGTLSTNVTTVTGATYTNYTTNIVINTTVTNTTTVTNVVTTNLTANLGQSQVGSSNNFCVALAGPGTNSVTVSGIGASNLLYFVAVYSYTNTGTYSVTANSPSVTTLTNYANFVTNVVINSIITNTDNATYTNYITNSTATMTVSPVVVLTTNNVAVTTIYTNAVFNNATVATNLFNGVGTVTNVVVTILPTNIPVGGAGIANIVAQFSTGESINVSGLPGVTLSSSNPSAIQATVGTSGGVLSATATGTATITAGYAGVTQMVAVQSHQPAWADGFTVPHDYLANGVTGSTWDGVYANTGDIPGGSATTFGTTIFNSSITHTNELYIQANSSFWTGASDYGPFLFKNILGDFQAWVQVTNMSTINTDRTGLMARWYKNNLGSTEGGPGGSTSGDESFITWFKAQAGAPIAAKTVNNTATTVVTDPTAGDTWLLLQRYQLTNFYYYAKTASSNSWALIGSTTVASTTGGTSNAMQVGIAEEMLAGNVGFDQFDGFVLDNTNVEGTNNLNPAGTIAEPPAATALSAVLNPNFTITVSWVSASNGVPVPSILVANVNEVVTAQPSYGVALPAGPYNVAYGTAGYSLGGGNYAVWRSSPTPASTNNTATISGFTAGSTYFFAAYPEIGAGTAAVYNNLVTTGTNNQIDGLPSGITAYIPLIPVGGVGRQQVLEGFQGSVQTADVSFLTAISSGNSNLFQVTNGLISAIGLGSAPITNVYNQKGFGLLTNVVTVTSYEPTIVDNFTNQGTNYIYGTLGSIWQNIWTNGGDIPNGTGTIGPNTTTNAVVGQWILYNLTTNIITNAGPPITYTTNYITNSSTTNDALFLTNTGGGWEADLGGAPFTAGGADDGTFLWLVAPGDFQEAVHLISYSSQVAYDEFGLLARGFSDTTNVPSTITGSTNYGPQAGTNGENYVELTRFDQFGFSTYARTTTDNVTIENTQPGPTGGTDHQTWMLIQRFNNTNFYLYQRQTNTMPWTLTPNKTSYVEPWAAGIPMQVGLHQESYSGNSSGCVYEQFMLDEGAPVLGVAPVAGGNIAIALPEGGSFHIYSSPNIALPHVDWNVVNTATLVSTTNNGIITYIIPINYGTNLYYQTGP